MSYKTRKLLLLKCDLLGFIKVSLIYIKRANSILKSCHTFLLGGSTQVFLKRLERQTPPVLIFRQITPRFNPLRW